MHTKDLGVFIESVLQGDDSGIDRFNWDDDESRMIEEGDHKKPFICNIDASHGFDNLVITDNSGDKFRVLITRIG